MMRVFLTTTLCAALSATMAMAEDGVFVSLGVMQRSYSDDVLIVEGNGGSTLTAADTETTGISLDTHLLAGPTWARIMVYADDFDQTITDASGIGFELDGGGFGVFGPGPLTGTFERDTGLLRFDLMQELTAFSGVEIFAGGSLVQINDDIGGFISNAAATNDIAFEGSTDMLGAVLGGRYDFAGGSLPSGLGLSAFGTLGIYHARHQMSASSVAPFAALDLTETAAETGIVGAAEIGFTASYSLSETSEIGLTYQAAFYGEAISTPNAVPQSELNPGFPPTTTSVATDSILYHGLSLSYTMRF